MFSKTKKVVVFVNGFIKSDCELPLGFVSSVGKLYMFTKLRGKILIKPRTSQKFNIS